MHDIKAIRENPDYFVRGWTNRKLDGKSLVDEILELDENLRTTLAVLQQFQNAKNAKAKEIGILKSKGQDVSSILGGEDYASMRISIILNEEKVAEIQKTLHDVLSAIPNIMQDDVPVGKDENDNVEIHKFGTPGTRNENPDHVAIGEGLGMMSAEWAAKLSGSRFTILHSGLARLERALGQFMIDTHVNEHGYTETSVPLLVRDHVMYGVGMLPKFGEDMFTTDTGHYLIPTAEASLTNLVADMILDEEALPLRLTAMTPCFRSEAGSAGKDTRGMIRQHQFYKVEMVSVTTPEQSVQEHERMTECAETILRKLELPFRRIVLCTGDAGFCSQKTYDLEVWLPGQGKYREISSCSNCGEFQARRMKARCRKRGTKDTRHVHTLNGSGIAVGRALVAVLENYYNPSDNSVTVPNVLRPYMNNLEKITGLSDDKALLRSAEG